MEGTKLLSGTILKEETEVVQLLKKYWNEHPNEKIRLREEAKDFASIFSPITGQLVFKRAVVAKKASEIIGDRYPHVSRYDDGKLSKLVLTGRST